MSNIYKVSENLYFAKILSGEDLLLALKNIAKKANVDIGFVQGIGALAKAKIGIYKEGEYEQIEIKPLKNRVLEVASLQGNIVKGGDGKYYPHVHIVLGRSKGETYAGHVLKGCIVQPFIEMFLYGGTLKANLIREFNHRWL